MVKLKLGLLGLALLLVTLGGRAVLKVMRQRDDALIEAHNLRAAADSLTLVHQDELTKTWRQLAFIQDTLGSVRRRLKNAGKPATVVDAKLKPDTVFVEKIEVAAATDTQYSTTVTGPPVDLDVTVALARPQEERQPVLATWRLGIRPWPIPVTVDVGCRGVNEPDVLVSGPPWVTWTDVTARTARGLCARDLTRPSRHGLGYYLVRVAALAGAAVLGNQLASDERP
jgi:hypothetical protein